MKPHNHLSLLAAVFAAAFWMAPAIAADSGRITLPLPPLPKITLPAPPAMIWLPAPQIHVAYDSPHPIFHHEGRYYLHHNDTWHTGPSHNGPWNLIKDKQVPKKLRKFKKDNWGHYQSEAARQFRGGHGDERHHHFYADQPQERATWNDQERRSGRGDHRDGHDKHDKKDKRKDKHDD